jgi:hypothetical protein
MRERYYDDQPIPLHRPFEQDPDRPKQSIFLAGPTAPGVVRTPWRAEALAYLAVKGYQGEVILPEFRSNMFISAKQIRFDDGEPSPIPHMSRATYNILQWETQCIESCDVLLIWMPFHLGQPHEASSLPGFTTRAEAARAIEGQRRNMVLGMPDEGVQSGGHIRFHAWQDGLPIHSTLRASIEAAMIMLEALRRG